MAALVTLAHAKLQLGVDGDDDNALIKLKLDQASAIVLDYLKSRLTAIASISVASPTVITTSVPHSLITGSTALIADTTTTPTVNGAQVITVTGPTTFTVPVNVTVGQTSAAGTIARPTWTDVTVPEPVQAATLLMLTHLFEHRGDEDMALDARLWEAVERLLVRFRDPALA